MYERSNGGTKEPQKESAVVNERERGSAADKDGHTGRERGGVREERANRE